MLDFMGQRPERILQIVTLVCIVSVVAAFLIALWGITSFMTFGRIFITDAIIWVASGLTLGIVAGKQKED
jgi:hypothetical protein